MNKPLALIAAVGLFCAGCAPASNTTPAPMQTTPTPSAPVSLSVDSGPQAPGGIVPATIGIAWDQASKDQAVDIAQKAMADFARPKAEETTVGQRSCPLAHPAGHRRLLRCRSGQHPSQPGHRPGQAGRRRIQRLRRHCYCPNQCRDLHAAAAPHGQGQRHVEGQPAHSTNVLSVAPLHLTHVKEESSWVLHQPGGPGLSKHQGHRPRERHRGGRCGR